MPRGPKGEKRPANAKDNAVHVMRIATGEIDESATADDGKNAAAVALGRMWSAPEFFNALLKEADRGPRMPNNGESAFQRMMGWFDPVDPLRISKEAEYKKRVPLKVWG